MKTITQIIALGLISLLINACSNDNKGSFDATSAQNIEITTCGTYVVIEPDDLLVKNDDNTTIQILHDVDGTKKVCVSSGNAHLVRGL